ncbi:MAG: hypothetical protein [Cressdnaviricota sp.]|nr:MAG: hypothetical protein [Cressdnaviricota sp.]
MIYASEARCPLSLRAAHGSYIYHKKYKFLSCRATMRKKANPVRYGNTRHHTQWMNKSSYMMRKRPYSRAKTHRDWSNYIPYKKYNDIVKAAQFTGKRRYLHLLRAQKQHVDLYKPSHFAARNPFLPLKSFM